MITNIFLPNVLKQKFEETQQYIKEYWEKSDKEINRTEEQLGYIIETFQIPTEPGYSSSCMARVSKDGQVLAEVFRNYHSNMAEIFHHPNGNDYLFCGHDYQGYSIVNLTQQITGIYMHHGTEAGWGWCPVDVRSYDSDEDDEGKNPTLRVYGCYWGGPIETRVLDFKTPDVLPLPILEEWDEYDVPYSNEETEERAELITSFVNDEDTEEG